MAEAKLPRSRSSTANSMPLLAVATTLALTPLLLAAFAPAVEVHTTAVDEPGIPVRLRSCRATRERSVPLAWSDSDLCRA